MDNKEKLKEILGKVVELRLTQDFLSDLLETASYGNAFFSFRCDKTQQQYHDAKAEQQYYDEEDNGIECGSDIWSYVLFNGGTIRIEIDEDGYEYNIGLDKIKDGLVGFSEYDAESFSRIILERYDADDADEFIQFMLFGKVIYG